VQDLDYPLFEIAADDTYVFYNDATSIYRTSVDGGTPIELVELTTTVVNRSPVTDMASDGTHLYYSDGTRIMKVPVAGGEATPLSWGWTAIQCLAVDANHVYFADRGGNAVIQIEK
jgi:hypothetical protein